MSSLMKELKDFYNIFIRNCLSVPYIPVNGYIHPVDRCRYVRQEWSVSAVTDNSKALRKNMVTRS
ncbi:hypothetical protein EWM84_23945 [Escherichia coli]|nr:hypothetical protein [Escherichia coli]